jgi:CDP-diglyceride synthetase
MNVFWKAFLGGAVCAILLLIFVPFFAEGMSPSVAIAKMTNNPVKTISLLEIIGITGLIFGCVFSLFAWIGRRKREREETDELMREYLRKKLQEEKDKQG